MNPFLKLLMASYSHNPPRAVILHKLHGKLPAGSNTHAFIAKTNGCLTQAVYETVWIAIAALKSLLGVFALAGLTSAKTVRQQQDSLRRVYFR
jgi:hypothetical protein